MNHGRDTIYYYIDQDDKAKSKKALFRLVDRRFSFVDVGYSYRLTELEAAVGLEGLRGLKKNVLMRRANARHLAQKLSSFEKYLQLPITGDDESSHMMFPVVIKKGMNIKRRELIEFLETHGIETRYAMPLLNQPVYKKLFGNIENKHPVAKWIDSNGFYIGCHQYLSQKDLDYIVKVFASFFRR